MATTTLPTGMIEELTSILGEGSVLVDVPARINRTRVPAPFPVHDWAAHVPQAVVLPETTEQVAAVVRLANIHGVGIIPRAGATGLADGAVPMRGGIVVDIKRMDKVLEIDEGARTVTVQTGIGLNVLDNRLTPLGFTYPDDPSSFPSALVGGRIGTGGWSHLAGRFGHTRDLVISMTVVLPTGEVVRVGDGGGAGIRKSSTGYQMKGLFFGHQGTLGIATEATLELIQRPEAEFTPLFAAADFETGYRAVGALARSGLATLSGVMFTDDSRIDFARREGAFAGEPDVGVVVHAMLLGSRVEVAAAGRVVMDIAAREGLRHLGDEESQHEWAARHLPPPGAAARAARRRAGGADDLARAGCRLPLPECAEAAGALARDHRAVQGNQRHHRQLGHDLLHQRCIQAVGRPGVHHRGRHLGAGLRRDHVAELGRL